MKLIIDKNNIITTSVTIGDVVAIKGEPVESITISDEMIPPGFEEDFWIGKWAYENGAIVRTSMPKPEAPEEPEEPDGTDWAALEQRIDDLEAAVDALTGGAAE